MGRPVDLDSRDPVPLDDWRETTDLLASYGVEFAPSVAVRDGAAAAAAARELGVPVAVKADPLAVAHKVAVDGVRTDLDDPDDVRRAFDAVKAATGTDVIVQNMVDGMELIAGIVDDPDFGPVLAFGPGGIFVEAFEDAFAYRALPIEAGTARELIGDSRADRVLAGIRGREPADRESIVAALVGLSDAYLDLDVSTLEVNPMIATADGAYAVDLLVE